MTETPKIVSEMTNYLRVVKNRSVQTIEQYEIDLVLFLKYIKSSRLGLPFDGEEFDGLSVDDCDLEFVKEVTTSEIYEFFTFVANIRNNSARTRARKLSSLKAFYRYLTVTKKYFEYDPVRDMDAPTVRNPLPKFLSLDESVDLLDTVINDTESRTKERDYAIVSLFLNSGMRLSELVGINLTDMDKDLKFLRVLGKGSKERIIYLNDASKNAIINWLEVRKNIDGIKDKNALFLSGRKTRISKKTVQWLVYKYLDRSGLGYKHCSVHKLRHTAATLMYQTGKVDVRVLKDILGHEQLNTTQIYTHVSAESMENAMNMNPLSKINTKKDT